MRTGLAKKQKTTMGYFDEHSRLFEPPSTPISKNG